MAVRFSLLAVILTFLSTSSVAGFQCTDLNKDASSCQKFKAEDQCLSLTALRGCQKTCNYCTSGWTNWSKWGDCTATVCKEMGVRVRVRRCRSVYRHIHCPGSTTNIKKCVRTNCGGENEECDASSFYCVPVNATSPAACLPKKFICDGYPDCLGEVDEENCKISEGPNDSFLLITPGDPVLCLKQSSTTGVTLTWRCANRNNPNFRNWLWKWDHLHNLRNIHSGKCLTAQSNGSLTISKCDNKDKLQLWTCSNSSFELLDNSTKTRFLDTNDDHDSIVSDNPNREWYIHGTNDSACSLKPGWTSWGSWSECKPECISLGIGIRRRFRNCTNGIEGHGACLGENKDDLPCDHAICRPQCPLGFDNSSFPWVCYKIEKKKKMNLEDAYKACSSIKEQGVSVHATLTADKTNKTQKALLALIGVNNSLDAYIGVTIHVQSSLIVTFNYSSDKQPIGDFKSSQLWHDITLEELANGWQNDSGSTFKLQLVDEGCLDISEDEYTVVISSCSSQRASWVVMNRVFIHVGTGKCLKHNSSVIYSSNASSITNATSSNAVIGADCSIRDDGIKWKLEDYAILPDDKEVHLTSKNGSLFFRDVTGLEWVAITVFSDIASLPATRDWSGSWFRFAYENLCMSAKDKTEVTLSKCYSLNSNQRWSILWEKLLLHRSSGQCLSVEKGSSIKNDTTVTLMPCAEQDKLQHWIVSAQEGDVSDRYHISPYRKDEFTIIPMCGKLLSGSIRLCVAESSESNEGYWEKQTEMEEDSNGKFLMMNVWKQEDTKIAVQPIDSKCNDTKLVYAEYVELTTQNEGWWSWSEEGRMLVNIKLSETAGFNCCLAVSEVGVDGHAVLRACDISDKDQMWVIAEGNRGSMVGLASNPSLILSLIHAPDSESERGRSSDNFIVLSNRRASEWNALSQNGVEMKISSVLDCMHLKDGIKGGYITHQYTASGKLCQAWNMQFPHKHTYPPVSHNYCRSPESYRSKIHPHWCLTTDPETRWEECSVPDCPLELGVILSAKTGVWKLTGGLKKLPYICEAPVECVKGIGADYKGTVSHTSSGKKCLNWKSLQERLNQKSHETSFVGESPGVAGSGIPAPDHTFCRNPNNDPEGLWCWVDSHIKEYCSYIQPCEVRCPPPLIPFRGQILDTAFMQPGINYANNSEVKFGCEPGYYKTYNTDVDVDDDLEYNLKCVDGKWQGILPACNVITCDIPEAGVGNAVLNLKKDSVPVNSSIVYKCTLGHSISNGKNSISLTCIGNNTWTADHLPIEAYYLSKNNFTTSDISKISCVSPCKAGFVAVSTWCFKILKTKSGLPFRESALPCPKGSMLPPPEVMLSPQTQPYLVNNIREQILTATEEVLSPAMGNDTNVFRSKMSEQVLNAGDYVQASFYVETLETFEHEENSTVNITVPLNKTVTELSNVTGNVESNGTVTINSTAANVTGEGARIGNGTETVVTKTVTTKTNVTYCLYAIMLAEIQLQPCPQNETHDGGFLFRWMTPRHLYHPFTDSCLAYEKPKVILKSCDWKGVLQEWRCESNHIILIKEKLYLDFSHESQPAPLQAVSSVDRERLGWKAGKYMAANLGPYKNRSICRPVFQPREEIFSASCTDRVDGVGWWEDSCSDKDNTTEPCALQSAAVAESTTFSSVDFQSCRCGWTGSENPVKPHLGSWVCEGSTMSECDENEKPKAVAWCKKSTSDLSNGFGKWCLGVRKADKFFQVMEMPCDVPVTEQICAVKARLSCKTPAETIKNGYRVGMKNVKEFNDTQMKEIEGQVPAQGFVVDSTVSYVCTPGYRFADGDASKQITCLRNGTWSSSTKISCMPLYCSRPHNPAHAYPITLPESITRVETGTKIQVTCNMGYNVEDGIATRTSICDVNGEWRPTVAKCKPVNCGRPPYVRNTVVIGVSFALRSTTMYKCKFGLHIVSKDGKMVNESIHTCSESGQWLPTPHKLRCASTMCPDVKNVIRSKGESVGKAITIGCTNGDTLYRKGEIVTGGFYQSVCDPRGKWKPPVDDLICGLTECPKHSTVFNADFRTLIPAPGSRNESKALLGATLKYQCKNGYKSYRNFLILNFVHQLLVCLGVNSTDHHRSLKTFDFDFCAYNVTDVVQWRWWPSNDRHLQHIATGLCMTSAVSMLEVQLNGKYEVILQQCNIEDKRQKWECATKDNQPFFVILNNDSVFKTKDSTLTNLRFDPMLSTVHISNTPHYVNGQWSTLEGNDICSQRKTTRIVEQYCTKDGHWIPAAEKLGCVPSTCIVPNNRTDLMFHKHPAVDRSNDGSEIQLQYGQSMLATCAEGYRVQSVSNPSTVKVTCNNLGKWKPDLDKSKCIPIFCEKLERIQHAIISPGTKGWSYMSEVKLTCEKGMWFKKARRRWQIISCGRDGAWSRPPSSLVCTVVQCPSLYQVPAFAKRITKPDGVNYRSAFMLQCEEGMWFSRDQVTVVVRCSEDSSWLPADLSCERITCISPPAYVAFATRDKTAIGLMPLGSKVSYSCLHGRKSNDSERVEVLCDLDGHWNPDPHMIACHVPGCISLKDLNSLFPNSALAGNNSAVNSTIQITCATGYLMSDGSNVKLLTCLSDLSWFPPPEAVQCKPVSCGRPKEVKYATIEVNGSVSYGDRVKLICEKNRFISLRGVGTIYLYCDRDGQWMPNPSKLSCVPATCQRPIASPLKKFRFFNADDRGLIGSKAILSCIEGFWFKPAVYDITLVCNSSGLWSPHPNSSPCHRVLCPDPTPLCNCKYVPIEPDSKSVTLNSTESFSPSLTSQSLFYSNNATGIQYGQDVEYICLDGYWISPGMVKQTITCQKDGTYTIPSWKLHACIPVACPTVPMLPQADVSEVKEGYLGSFSVGTTVTYNCFEGWWFEGAWSAQAEITCSSKAIWDPDPFLLECVRVKCPPLSPHHLNNSFSRGYGTEIDVSCKFGYMLGKYIYDKTTKLTCSKTGIWQPEFPDGVCVPITCGPLKMVRNAYSPSVTDATYGKKAKYTCKRGWSVKRGERSWEVTCSGYGIWLPHDEQCVRDDAFVCDAPPFIEHASRLLPPEYLEGKIAIYSCDEDYWMSGNRTIQTITCKSSGGWVPDIDKIKCHPVTCEAPTTPEDLELVTNSSADLRPYYKTGQERVYRCVADHWVERDAIEIVSVCQTNGNWFPDIANIVCSPYDCPKLPDIEHASYTVYVNALNYPEAKYWCKPGYIYAPSLLSKTKYFTTSCIMGRWVPPPIERTCSVVACKDLPVVSQSYYLLNSKEVGSTAWYYCNKGYRWKHMATKVEVKCNEMGEWEPHPLNYRCEDVECGKPLSIENAKVAYTATTYLKAAVYTCSIGMKIEGTTNITMSTYCQADGLWMPSPVNLVRCVHVTCPTPPAITHAIALDGANYYGSKWNYRCEKGFHVGSGVNIFSISCSVAGIWWPSNKKCISMKCGYPPKIPKSKIIYYNKTVMEDDRISENAQYLCAKGRWISKGAYKDFTINVTCVDGSWNPSPIRAVRCVLVTCDVLPDPVIEDGTMQLNRSHSQNEPRYKSTVTMECPVGQFFRPLKSRRLTTICQADGRWSVMAHGLKCEPTSCPIDIEDPNAVWSQPADTLIGATAQVNCKPTFWLDEGIRSVTVTCGENGRWLPELKCLPVSCPNPTTEHATFIFVKGSSNHSDHYPVSSRIKFTCNKGYEIWTDVGTLTCEVTGQWNPRHTTVTCHPIQCAMPPKKPDNSEYLGANYFNSTLRMQCNKGFMIAAGDTYKSAKCMENSNWNEDISNYKCVPLHCKHTGTIDNGTIVSTSSPPFYKYEEVVRVSCLQGYWSSRNVRQFSSKCGDDADWEPRLDDVKCERISCIKPPLKSFSEFHEESLIAGSNLTLRCDPVHWIFEKINESWYLQPKIVLNFTCTERGEWNINPKNIKCASTTTLSESLIGINNASLSLDQIEYVPSSEFQWLNNHISYVISGPGDGSEVGHWIKRLTEKRRSKSQRGLSELREAMQQYPVYNRILSRMLFKKPSNETLIRCLQRYNSTEMQNGMRMYMEGEQNASILFKSTSPLCINISIEQNTFNSSVNSSDMAILLARSTDMLNHTSAIDGIRKETVESVRQSRMKARAKMRGRLAVKRSNYPVIISGKESALWDGDPLTAWKPSEHSITWKFEIHLGDTYIVKDIILMTSSDALANISFSVADGSLHKKTFGPFDLRSKEQKYFTSPVKVTITEASYDAIVTFSDFPVRPVGLIEFSFDLPPAIREIGFLASPAKKIIVVYLDPFYHTLYAIIALFTCLVLFTIVLDKQQNKNMAITWFGKQDDGIPCIVQFQTKKKPRVSLDIYLHVLTNSHACHGSVVAWLRARPNSNWLNGRDIVGLYSVPPDTDKVNLRIACAIVEEERYGAMTQKANSATWVFDNVKMLFGGKKWVGTKSRFDLTPATRLNIALREKFDDKNGVIYCIGTLLKKHMLAFLYPYFGQNYQILRLSPRLVAVFFATSLSMSVAVTVHEFSDFLLSFSGFPLNLQALDGGYVNMSGKSAAAVLAGFLSGVIALFLLRFLFIYMAKVERRLRYSSKGTSAVLRIPGIYLYNLLMTGRMRLSGSEDGRSGLGIKKYPFPSPSTLIRWLRERRRNQFKSLPEKSKSSPVRKHLFQPAPHPSSGISCASKPVASVTDYSYSQSDSADYSGSYDEEYSQETVSKLFSDEMATSQSIAEEFSHSGEESAQHSLQSQASKLSSAYSSSATLKGSYESQASLRASEYTITGDSTPYTRDSLSDVKTISLTKSTSQSKTSSSDKFSRKSTISSFSQESSVSSGQTLIDIGATSSSDSPRQSKSSSSTVPEINEKLKIRGLSNKTGENVQIMDPIVTSIRWSGPGKNLVDANTVRVNIVSEDASKSPVMKVKGTLVMNKPSKIEKRSKDIDRPVRLKSRGEELPTRKDFTESSGTIGKELDQSDKATRDSLESYSIMESSLTRDSRLLSSKMTDSTSASQNTAKTSSILTSEPEFSKIKHSSSIDASRTSNSIMESFLTRDSRLSSSKMTDSTSTSQNTTKTSSILTSESEFSKVKHSSSIGTASTSTESSQSSDTEDSDSLNTTIIKEESMTSAMGSSNQEGISTLSGIISTQSGITEMSGNKSSNIASFLSDSNDKSQQRYSGLSEILHGASDAGSDAGFSDSSIKSTGKSAVSKSGISSSSISSSEETSSSFDTSTPSDSTTTTSSSELSSTSSDTSSDYTSESGILSSSRSSESSVVSKPSKGGKQSIESGRTNFSVSIYGSQEGSSVFSDDKSVEVSNDNYATSVSDEGSSSTHISGSSYTSSDDTLTSLYSTDNFSTSISDEGSSSTLTSGSSFTSSDDALTSLSSTDSFSVSVSDEGSSSTLTSGSSFTSSDDALTSLSSTDSFSVSVSDEGSSSTLTSGSSFTSSDDTHTSQSNTDSFSISVSDEGSSSTLTSGSSFTSSDDAHTSQSNTDSFSTSISDEGSSSTLRSGSSYTSTDDTLTDRSSQSSSKSFSGRDSVSYSQTGDDDSDSSSTSSLGSTGTVKSWKPTSSFDQSDSQFQTSIEKSSLVAADTSSDYIKTTDTSTRTTELSSVSRSDLSHKQRRDTLATISVDSTFEGIVTEPDSKLSSHSGFSSDFRSVVESSSFSSAVERDSSSTQSTLTEVGSQRDLEGGDKPGVSLSKTTDISSISVATGRRTIYPHANAVHFLSDDTQLYIAPTSLLMIVVTMFSGIALSACYSMVLGADVDVKYVRDAAILSCALVISLGTFLEVMISSGIMYFAGIADEVDFEKEAPQLAKVEKTEPLCLDKKLNDEVSSGQLELDMEAGGDADSMTTLLDDTLKKRRRKGKLFSRAIQYSGDYDWQRERFQIMRKMAKGTKDDDTFSTRSCPRNMMFGRTRSRDVAIQVEEDDVSRKDFFVQLDLSLSNAARELAVLESSSSLDDKVSREKDVHREPVAERGDEVRDFGKRTDDIHRNLVDQLKVDDIAKKSMLPTGDEDIISSKTDGEPDTKANEELVKLPIHDYEEEETTSSKNLSQFEEGETRQLQNMEDDESVHAFTIEKDDSLIDYMGVGSEEDPSEIYWDAIDTRSLPALKTSDITLTSEKIDKDIMIKSIITSDHTTETSSTTLTDKTKTAIEDTSVMTQATFTSSESSGKTPQQYNVNFEFELELDKFFLSALERKSVPTTDKSIQAKLSRERAVIEEDSSSEQSPLTQSKDSEVTRSTMSESGSQDWSSIRASDISTETTTITSSFLMESSSYSKISELDSTTDISTTAETSLSLQTTTDHSHTTSEKIPSSVSVHSSAKDSSITSYEYMNSEQSDLSSQKTFADRSKSLDTVDEYSSQDEEEVEPSKKKPFWKKILNIAKLLTKSPTPEEDFQTDVSLESTEESQLNIHEYSITDDESSDVSPSDSDSKFQLQQYRESSTLSATSSVKSSVDHLVDTSTAKENYDSKSRTTDDLKTHETHIKSPMINTQTKKPKLDTRKTAEGKESTSMVTDATATSESKHSTRLSLPHSLDDKKHPPEAESSLAGDWPSVDKSVSSVYKSESKITSDNSKEISSLSEPSVVASEDSIASIASMKEDTKFQIITAQEPVKFKKVSTGKVILCRVESLTQMKPRVQKKSDQRGVVTCKIESKHKILNTEMADSGIATDMQRKKHSESLTDALAGVLVDKVLQNQKEKASTSALKTAEDIKFLVDKKPSVTDDLAEIFVEKQLDRIKHDVRMHQLDRDDSYDSPMVESKSSESFISVTSVSGDGLKDSKQIGTSTLQVPSEEGVSSSILPTMPVHDMSSTEDFEHTESVRFGKGTNALCKVESVEFSSDKTPKIFLKRVRKQPFKPEQSSLEEQKSNAAETSDSLFEDAEIAEQESTKAGTDSKASLLAQQTSSSLESESKTSSSDASMTSIAELRSIRQIFADLRGVVAEEYERISNRPIQEPVVARQAREVRAGQDRTSSGISQSNQSDQHWNEQVSDIRQKLEYAKQYAEFLRNRK